MTDKIEVGNVVTSDGVTPVRNDDRVQVSVPRDEDAGIFYQPGCVVWCVEGDGPGEVSIEETEDGVKKAFIHVDE